jgi:hypothetical protein
MTLGECEFARVTPIKNGSKFDACLEQRNLVDSNITLIQPDLVVISSSWATSFAEGEKLWSQGFASRLDFLKAAGARVLIIGTTPGAGNWSECLKGNVISGCMGSSEVGFKRRSRESLESKKRGFAYLDSEKILCVSQYCPSVIDDIPVYWDGSHLSSEMSATLSSFIKISIKKNYPNLLTIN